MRNTGGKPLFVQCNPVIGEDARLGEGKCYVRFVLASLFSINPDIIESVQYHTMSLNLANVAFYEVEEDWCSLTSTWETPITTGPLVAEIHDGRKGIQVFDLTKAARTWFADPDCLKERYGLLLAVRFSRIPQRLSLP